VEYTSQEEDNNWRRNHRSSTTFTSTNSINDEVQRRNTVAERPSNLDIHEELETKTKHNKLKQRQSSIRRLGESLKRGWNRVRGTSEIDDNNAKNEQS